MIMNYQEALSYMRKTKLPIISEVSNKEYELIPVQDGKSTSYQTVSNGTISSPSTEERLGEWSKVNEKR